MIKETVVERLIRHRNFRRFCAQWNKMKHSPSYHNKGILIRTLAKCEVIIKI